MRNKRKSTENQNKTDKMMTSLIKSRIKGEIMSKGKVKGYLLCMILATLIVQFSGCYVTKGFVPIVPQKPFEMIPASASLSIDISHSFDGERATGAQNQTRVDDVKKISKEVFQKSGLFKVVDYNLFKPDLFIDFKVSEQEKGSSGNAMLSGFTLMLIPAKTGASFEVEAILKNKQGHVIGSYRSKGDFNVIIHLIFIFPIGWRFDIPNQIYEAIFRDISHQIANDRLKILSGLA